MKKISALLVTLLWVCVLSVCLLAADVVFVDGTVAASGDGTTPETAYKSLKEGIAALPNGGTLVFSGDTTLSTAYNQAATSGTVLLTSVYNGVDYGGRLILKSRLIFTGDATLDNITIHNGNTAPCMIFARGYTLTMGENVKCTTAGDALCYPVVYGGKYNGAHTGNSHVIIKGGTWRSVFGGNYENTFNGNSIVDFTGGTVLYSLVGGSFTGNFTGSSTVNIGGNAIVEFNTVYDSVAKLDVAVGVTGSCVGDGTATGNSYTFTGDIDINISGNAQIFSNVLGGAPRADVTTKGDIAINVSESPNFYRNLYGAGWYGSTVTNEDGITVRIGGSAVFNNYKTSSSWYVSAGSFQGTVTGDATVIVDGDVDIFGNVNAAGYKNTLVGNATAILKNGEIHTNFTAGTRSGTVKGNAVTEAYGGRVGYRAKDDINSRGGYALRGNGGYNSETEYGKVTGTATVLLDGADVFGSVTLGGANGTLTLKSGSCGDVPDTAIIDLSAGGKLSAGCDVVSSSLVGGGTLEIGSAGSLTVDNVSGVTTLVISGLPIHNHTYVTAKAFAEGGAIRYTPTNGETMDADYTVHYAGYHDTTRVRIYYYDPLGEMQPMLDLRRGLYESESKVKLSPVTGTENGKQYAEIDLTPGMYYYRVYHDISHPTGSVDWRIKYFYVSGETESMTFDQPYEPYVADSYMGTFTRENTDELASAFFDYTQIEGYTMPDTPTFTKHFDATDRSYMSNADLQEYVNALDASCDYLHVYYPFANSIMGNQWPILVFTKDTVPADATLEEVGALVQSGTREVIMISGGVHGCEPSGTEGSLWFAKYLTGAYGSSLLDKDFIGAVVIMPNVSADNLQRFQYYNANKVNPQRDLLNLNSEGTEHQVYVYKTFMPTVYFDCHEDGGRLVASDSDYAIIDTTRDAVSRIDDVVVRYAPTYNAPIADLDGILDGTAPIKDQTGLAINHAVIRKLEEKGLRSDYYFNPSPTGNSSWAYATVRGSYGFLVETMRIWSGKYRYPRTVNSIREALITLTDEVVGYEGQLAQNVKDARNAAIVTKFDESHVFAKETVTTGDMKFLTTHPSVRLDGTVKDADATTYMYHPDLPRDLIAMATAYVLPADTPGIADVLSMLEKHGVRYTKLRAGATLTLRKYTGLESAKSDEDSVSIGDAKEVSFANGAYAVTLDTSDSYLITYLFEPDSYARYSSYYNDTHSLAQMGFLTDADTLYRAEVDDVATLIRAQAELVGDITGDGVLDVADVLTLLRALLNDETPANCDATGDGRVSLADVLRILRTIV